MVGCVLAHPELQGLRRIMLTTLDAQELYRRLGFHEVEHPERVMEIFDPNVACDCRSALS